ncbi:MAG: hypothetical protein AB7F86_19445 [Bdellovibrionales bacterium]
MRNEKRTDRVLIALALIILLIAGGLFHFDSWMWGGSGERGEPIGKVAEKSGDVRLKYEGELKWQRARPGDSLVYNDAIFSGAGSEAKLNLGESQMTVTENTLIVLRRDSNVNFLNLNYGTLLGKIAKQDKLIIDTGDGRKMEFETSSGAQIILHKVGKKTQLDVTSGTAKVKIEGKDYQLDTSNKLTIAEKPVLSKKVNNRLRALRPLKDQVIYSEEPIKIPFAWAWESVRSESPDDRYTLEFSSTPDFSKIQTRKEVAGLTTELGVSKSLSLYYRVRGPEKSVSQTERVKFVRLTRPIIVSPVAEQQFTIEEGQVEYPVVIEFKRPEASTVWFQLASDPEFKSVFENLNTGDQRLVRRMPAGDFFIRARGDFGGDHATAWGESVHFKVNPAPQELRLVQRSRARKVIIPNRLYPGNLYRASDTSVSRYLTDKGLLRNFFGVPKDAFDKLKVQLPSTGEEIEQTDAGWPVAKARPGRYKYTYSLEKEGFKPSPKSSPGTLEIAMEPPRPIGEANYTPIAPDGTVDADWQFTPILFAGSYDVEVATEPGFQAPQEFRTREAVAKTSLTAGESYFWRARARDRQGRIISEFSQPHRLKPISGVPQMLAQNRRPAQKDTTNDTTRIRRKAERLKRDEDWIHNGWWAWLGSGMNYTNYKQSAPNFSTASTENVKGPSNYFETGYTGVRGWGGVVSYKSTPGEVLIDQLPDGVTFDGASYTWTTVSIEGIMRRLSGFKLLGRPILMGFRAGLQQHHMPFLIYNADDSILNLSYNTMRTASLGLLAEMNRKRWTYYWLMRYQYPFSTQADGSSSFEIKPTFGFDGSIGTSYNMTAQVKLGMFWYGQWHQFNFTHSSATSAGTQTVSGFQSLFYSNVDLRLGIDF